MTTDFLSRLPSLNPLSPSYDATVAAQKQFAGRADGNSEYYTFRKYNEAWKSACFTMLKEIHAAGATSQRNLIQARTCVKFPSHTPLFDAVVSMYCLSLSH